MTTWIRALTSARSRGADRQMQIREHRRLRDARIDHDHGLVGIRLQAAAQDRVVVGDVRADQQDEIGKFDLHAAGGPSLPNDRL